MCFIKDGNQEQSGAVEACWAHNPEVRGSKPRSAKFFCLNYMCIRISNIFHIHGTALHTFHICTFSLSFLIFKIEIFTQNVFHYLFSNNVCGGGSSITVGLLSISNTVLLWAAFGESAKKNLYKMSDVWRLWKRLSYWSEYIL